MDTNSFLELYDSKSWNTIAYCNQKKYHYINCFETNQLSFMSLYHVKCTQSSERNEQNKNKFYENITIIIFKMYTSFTIISKSLNIFSSLNIITVSLNSKTHTVKFYRQKWKYKTSIIVIIIMSIQINIFIHSINISFLIQPHFYNVCIVINISQINNKVFQN